MISEVLLLGLILSADSFSAAVAMGGRQFRTADSITFALASGGAEAISTLIGYLAGSTVIARISAYDHWVAFGLLAAVAVHMAIEGVQQLRVPPDDFDNSDFHGFAKILVVSFATSMDAFGVGIGLGVSGRPLAPFLASIAAWAFVATIVGLHVGSRISKKLGPVFTLIAAAVLGAISINMLSI